MFAMNLHTPNSADGLIIHARHRSSDDFGPLSSSYIAVDDE